jgi:hypothetical protein
MPQINENEARIVEDREPIQYFVSSCLTVTCGFADGSMIGAHFSHGVGTVGTYGDSVTTWGVFTDAVKSKVATNGGASWVVVRGQTDMWQPAYLTTQRLTADTATPGDLSSAISLVTGRDPVIAAQNGSIVVMSDGTLM